MGTLPVLVTLATLSPHATFATLHTLPTGTKNVSNVIERKSCGYSVPRRKEMKEIRSRCCSNISRLTVYDTENKNVSLSCLLKKGKSARAHVEKVTM